MSDARYSALLFVRIASTFFARGLARSWWYLRTRSYGWREWWSTIVINTSYSPSLWPVLVVKCVSCHLSGLCASVASRCTRARALHDICITFTLTCDENRCGLMDISAIERLPAAQNPTLHHPNSVHRLRRDESIR